MSRHKAFEDLPLSGRECCDALIDLGAFRLLSRIAVLPVKR
jgi:hypothetical protein